MNDRLDIAIYTLASGTSGGPTIHHFLSKYGDEYGPNLYEDNLINDEIIKLYRKDKDAFYTKFLEHFTSTTTNPKLMKDMGAQIVLESRNIRDIEDSDYEVHQDSLRFMTNTDVSGKNNTLDQYFNHFDGLKYRIWSNYYGAFKHLESYPRCDKLIFCTSTLTHENFDYISGKSTYPLSLEKIDLDSELWWKDHVYVNKKNVSLWKDIWYTKYHDRCKQEYEKGNLLHFWQLNFLHWDLFEALNQGRQEIDFDIGLHRLFEDTWKNRHRIRRKQQQLAEYYNTNNVTFLQIPEDWWWHIEDITDYLKIPPPSKELVEWIEVYKAIYYIKKQVYYRFYWEYLIKHQARVR